MSNIDHVHSAAPVGPAGWPGLWKGKTMKGEMQPIRDVMHTHGWTVTALAAECGVTYNHMRAVVYGYCRPVDHLRQVLPDILGVGLNELFDANALAKPYRVVESDPVCVGMVNV